MPSMKNSLGAKTLVYPTPVFVVGTYDKEGKPNVMTASWGGICCSQPPCVAVSLRKATYTHGNILARKAFTISIPSESHVQQADYFNPREPFSILFLDRSGCPPFRLFRLHDQDHSVHL